MISVRLECRMYHSPHFSTCIHGVWKKFSRSIPLWTNSVVCVSSWCRNIFLLMHNFHNFVQSHSIVVVMNIVFVVLVTIKFFHATIFPFPIQAIFLVLFYWILDADFISILWVVTTHNTSATLRQFGVYKHQHHAVSI